MSLMALTAVRRVWNSESSPLALRTKQLVASVLPEQILLQLKKRYYVHLLRDDSDALMEAEAKALPRFVKAGDFVIDVGASFGFYTRRLSRLAGRTGLVWSFEPLPPTFEILRTAVERLALDNVAIFPYAVSDEEGSAVMEIPRYRGGGESWWDARIVRSGATAKGFRRFETVTRTLDSLLAGSNRPVAFIKIDAEYHELHCVRGAVESLRRWHPVIEMETLGTVDQDGSDLQAVVALLSGLGYLAYVFDGNDFHPRQHREKTQNLFFLCDNHVRALASSSH